MTALPLAGITVVSIEQAVAAPFATRQLADLGARVIKVERPDGGDFARSYDASVKGQSAYFAWLNRGKQSLTLDLKHPDALPILARLIDRSDIFVQNLAPGAAERLGLGAQRLRLNNPRLIVCNISGYGANGPYADKKAYDLLIQSEVGLVSITGSEEVPSRVGISIADIAAGMYGYSGILAALIGRGKTGEGTTLEVSLFDALTEWMGQPIYTVQHGGTIRRTGADHSSIAPYGPFRSGDGDLVVFSVQNDREWKSLCSNVLGKPELADDARFITNPLRVKHRHDLHLEIDAAFGRLATKELLEQLDAAQIASARINTVKEFLEHPQLTGRDVWREIDSPGGPIGALLPPVRMEGVEAAMGAIPALGEHSEAILRELHCTAENIAKWKTEGMI